MKISCSVTFHLVLFLCSCNGPHKLNILGKDLVEGLKLQGQVGLAKEISENPKFDPLKDYSYINIYKYDFLYNKHCLNVILDDDFLMKGYPRGDRLEYERYDLRGESLDVFDEAKEKYSKKYLEFDIIISGFCREILGDHLIRDLKCLLGLYFYERPKILDLDDLCFLRKDLSLLRREINNITFIWNDFGKNDSLINIISANFNECIGKSIILHYLDKDRFLILIKPLDKGFIATAIGIYNQSNGAKNGIRSFVDFMSYKFGMSRGGACRMFSFFDKSYNAKNRLPL